MKDMSETQNEAKLYYVIDPMCSWCWGFRPTWEAVAAQLSDKITINYMMGGLAPDSDEPMPIEMQEKLQAIWRKIQTVIPQTQFNFDFWAQCKPRRSTYPACRAVIAARNQGIGAEEKMILAIQQAYYLQARNPSDIDTLAELGAELGFNKVKFEFDMMAEETNSTLLAEIQQNREFGAPGFPSLVLNNTEQSKLLIIKFGDAESIIQQVLTN